MCAKNKEKRHRKVIKEFVPKNIFLSERNNDFY